MEMRGITAATPIQFGKNYKILVAEDDADTRELAREFIPQFNEEDGDTFTPITAPNAETAMEILSHEDVDFVVTDGRMPREGDGVRLLQFIQRLDHKPKASVMLSGDGPEARVQALASGAAEFFRKGQQSLFDVMAFFMSLISTNPSPSAGNNTSQSEHHPAP